MKNLKLLISSLIIFSLITAPLRAVAQQATETSGSNLDAWLASKPSQELSFVLGKFAEFITPTSAQSQTTSDLPEELQGLIEDTSSLDQERRNSQILNSENGNVGLIDRAFALSVADFNRLILIATIAYQEKSEARPAIEEFFAEMQSRYQTHLAQENPALGSQMANSAFTFFSVLVSARLALSVGRMPWSQRLLGRLPFRFSTPGFVSGNQALSGVRKFLNTRRGAVSLHAAALGAGAGTALVQNQLYTLQTQKLAPQDALQMVQSDLACDLAHAAVALKSEIASSPVTDTSWDQLLIWSNAVNSSFALQAELKASFEGLTDLWTESQKDWPAIRDQVAQQLKISEPAFSCNRVQDARTRADLAAADFEFKRRFRDNIEHIDPAYTSYVLEAQPGLFEDNKEWLTEQDDFMANLPWIRALVFPQERPQNSQMNRQK